MRTDRGLLDASSLEGVPGDLPADEIARLTTETQTPLGRLRHLAPVVQEAGGLFLPRKCILTRQATRTVT